VPDLPHIIGRLPIGVWVASAPNGVAVYTNAAFLDIMGRAAAEGSPIEDAPRAYGIFDRAGRPYPVSGLPFSRVVATRQAVVVDDLVIHRADQQRINVRCFAHPVFGEAGALTHVSIAFIDITREVQAEQERDQAAAQLALAVDHAPIVIWAADQQGVITLSQGAALASLGVKSGQLVGHNIFDLYAGHPTIAGYIRRGLAGESLQYQVEVGEAAFDTWIAPIRNAEGAVVGITALSHDVRELRKLQAAGIQNDRTAALGTLAASVAHDIHHAVAELGKPLLVDRSDFERVQLPSHFRESRFDLRERFGGLTRTIQIIGELVTTASFVKVVIDLRQNRRQRDQERRGCNDWPTVTAFAEFAD